MAFFKGFIDTAKAPPPWLRMVNKRGTFFLPLDPRRTPSASLPKLLKRHVQLCVLHSDLNVTKEPWCKTTTAAQRAQPKDRFCPFEVLPALCQLSYALVDIYQNFMTLPIRCL